MSCGVSQSFGAACFAFPFCEKTNGPRVQHQPLCLCQPFTEKGIERRAKISLLLLPPKVSLVDDAVVQVQSLYPTIIFDESLAFQGVNDRYQGEFVLVKEQASASFLSGRSANQAAICTCANIAVLFLQLF